MSRITPTRLEQAQIDIEHFITDPEDRAAAVKQLSSLRDFAVGDDKACSWAAAIENCQQLKSYLPADGSASAAENFDAIAAEVHAYKESQESSVVKILTSPLFVIAVIVFVIVYFLFFRP